MSQDRSDSPEKPLGQRETFRIIITVEDGNLDFKSENMTDAQTLSILHLVFNTLMSKYVDHTFRRSLGAIDPNNIPEPDKKEDDNPQLAFPYSKEIQ